MPETNDDLGRFANDEAEDNAIDVSNPNYIGVDPEYRNHADYEDAPSLAPNATEDDEDIARLEELAKNHGQTTTGIHGYTTRTEDKAAQAAASEDTSDDVEPEPVIEDEANSTGGYTPPAAPFA